VSVVAVVVVVVVVVVGVVGVVVVVSVAVWAKAGPAAHTNIVMLASTAASTDAASLENDLLRATRTDEPCHGADPRGSSEVGDDLTRIQLEEAPRITNPKMIEPMPYTINQIPSRIASVA
jgi:hypothetical protein